MARIKTKVKSKFVKCCRCEVPIEIDKNSFINGGGEVKIVFGYGSTNDGSIYEGFICDYCFSTLLHLKEKPYL